MMTYFELISNNKSEIDYLNKYFSTIIEESLNNLNKLGCMFMNDNVDLDNQKIGHVVVMIMITLYNYRHHYKIIEETSKEDSKTNFSNLADRFEQFEKVIRDLCGRDKYLSNFIN